MFFPLCRPSISLSANTAYLKQFVWSLIQWQTTPSRLRQWLNVQPSDESWIFDKSVDNTIFNSTLFSLNKESVQALEVSAHSSETSRGHEFNVSIRSRHGSLSTWRNEIWSPTIHLTRHFLNFSKSTVIKLFSLLCAEASLERIAWSPFITMPCFTLR